MTIDEPVEKIEMNVLGLSMPTSNTMIYRKVIPRTQYNIHDNKELMYFITFDHTPLDKVCTGCLIYPNETKNDKENIEIHLNIAPGQYDVIIMGRCFNILEITKGMGTLKWPVRSSA